jgi:hypothetical protein
VKVGPGSLGAAAAALCLATQLFAPAALADSGISGAAQRLFGRQLFLEKNYIFWNVPQIAPTGDRGNAPLLLETWVAPHLSIYNRLDHLDKPENEPVSVFFALSITPQFRLRMVQNDAALHNTSTPVRPISFMPRLDAQWFVMFCRTGGDPGGAAAWLTGNDASSMARVWIVAPRLFVGHHSNGQEHCRFDKSETTLDGSTDPATRCPPWDGNLQDVNTRSGDFGTDYFGGGLNAAVFSLDGDNFERRKLALGVLYERHPLISWLPGGIDDQEAGLYGQNTLHFEGEIQQFLHRNTTVGWWSGRARLAGAYDRFWSSGADVVPYRASVEASFTSFWLGGFGLFARGMFGRDYMNILFVEPAISSLQLGVIFDPEPLMRFRPR